MFGNECPWNSRHLMTRKIAHPGGARTHNLEITYRVPFIAIMSQIIKAMHLKYISIYQGLQTQKLCVKMTKIWIADVRWQPFWLLRFVEKTVTFTAWHTAEIDSAQKIYIETTNEVLFLTNAYRSFSRAVFHFWPDYRKGTLLVYTRQEIGVFDPNWAFPDCNSSLNSPMGLKWWTKLGVV